MVHRVFYTCLTCQKGQKLLFVLIVINSQFLNIEWILINSLLIQGHFGNCFLTSPFAFMYRTISDVLVTRLFVILQWFMANLIKLLTPLPESSSVFLFKYCKVTVCEPVPYGPYHTELNRHSCLQSVCVCDMSAILWIRVVCVCSVSAFFENAVICVCFVSALFLNGIVCVCDVSVLWNYTYVRVCSVSALEKVQLSVYASVTCLVCVCAFENT